MPSFNFKGQFAGAVESGAKRQTIRTKRKNRPRVGQTAWCFYGMREKGCRLLGAWPIAAVSDVRIDVYGVIIDGAVLHADDLDAFAVSDGFRAWREMLGWFRRTHGLPFRGDLIMWAVPEYPAHTPGHGAGRVTGSP